MQILDDVPASFERIAEVLRNGGIICYPTETFYALGVDPWNEAACRRLYDLKKRTSDKELPLIVADFEMAAKFFDTSDPHTQTLIRKFWPGPLTLIIPAIDKSRNYAVRISSHPEARKISETFQKPVVSTSANISGNRPICSPGELNHQLISGIDVLLDGGTSAGGLPSTIVSLISSEIEIIREGAIQSEKIFSAL
ncbi:MAG TPA: L-threonylcarbamoyladenylate synthase [Acidobacteriota bacterium]|nr:L-threonylcarbamoyladenylate synthase [Acidobacteriota bacterium]